LTSFGIPTNAYDGSGVGVLAGGEAGYNFRTGNIVYGVEGDIAYTNIDVTSRYDQRFTFPCCTVVWATSVHQSLDSLSTLRARVGYAFGNVLLYGTGGLALGQVEYSFNLNFPAFGAPGVTAVAYDKKSELAVGYTLGGGVELGFGNWSLKTEYLFY